jgi:hypothetical protein
LVNSYVWALCKEWLSQLLSRAVFGREDVAAAEVDQAVGRMPLGATDNE